LQEPCNNTPTLVSSAIQSFGNHQLFTKKNKLNAATNAMGTKWLLQQGSYQRFISEEVNSLARLFVLTDKKWHRKTGAIL
jgi:hypothetical protein